MRGVVESDEFVANLSDLVRHHRKTFAWYDKLLADRGVGQVTSLAELPILDAAILQEHYYSQLREDLNDADVFLTSGTSGGGRKQIKYSKADEEAYIRHRKGFFQNFLATVPRPAIAVADLGTGHAAASAHRVFLELGFEARDIEFTEPLERHVELLRQWQPAVLFTMPMILDRIMGATSDRFGIKKIAVVGDLAPANWRRSVAREFRLQLDDVLDLYGSIEIGAIAYLAAESGRYQFHDHIFAEVIEPANNDNGSGADQGTGVLALTSFAREYFPAVRFRTDDVVRGLRTVAAGGRHIQTFERLLGRCGEEYKHGERISQHDIYSAVRDVFDGAPFEVVAGDNLEVRVVTDCLDEKRVSEFRGRLAALCPDVGQMIASALVGDIRVIAIKETDLQSLRGKRIVGKRGAD